MSLIFVFGSNLLGLHGGGAARVAYDNHGAKWGVGEGRTGLAYALPTKANFSRTLTVDEIAAHVRTFVDHARAHPDDTFLLTQVGCGLAGLTKEQIAPLFINIPENVKIPLVWHKMVFGNVITHRISFNF